MAGGRGKRHYPAYRVPSGSSEFHFPLGCKEVALTLCTGGHTSWAARRTTKQKANYSKRPKPWLQHKASLVTQSASNTLLSYDTLLPREPFPFATPQIHQQSSETSPHAFLLDAVLSHCPPPFKPSSNSALPLLFFRAAFFWLLTSNTQLPITH